MARPPPSLFPICQGGPNTIPYQIVQYHTIPYPPTIPYQSVQYTIYNVHSLYHTKLCTTTTSCHGIPNHTKSHHTILGRSIHHTSPQLSRADQDWPKSPILGSTEESTWVYISEESTPPTFCLHSPLGAATSRHQCFFIVSFPSTNLFRLCSKILWLRFEMSTAHIWTLACSGLERCFITAVCKRQIDYLDNLNNQLASAQTLIQIQRHIRMQQITNTLRQQFLDIKWVDNQLGKISRWRSSS